ncbi:hypothetical protein V8C86DRAFT_2565173 [Haematococcus lacustris]
MTLPPRMYLSYPSNEHGYISYGAASLPACPSLFSLLLLDSPSELRCTSRQPSLQKAISESWLPRASSAASTIQRLWRRRQQLRSAQIKEATGSEEPAVPRQLPQVPQPPAVSSFTQCGRPCKFNAPKLRTWDPAADHFAHRFHALTVRVPRPDPGIDPAEAAAILAGGFWLPSLSKSDAALLAEGKLPASLQQQQTQGHGGNNAGVPEGTQGLSKFMQAHLQLMQREAEEALQLLRCRSSHLADSMHRSLAHMSQTVSGTRPLQRLRCFASSLLCCCGPSAVADDDEVSAPLLCETDQNGHNGPSLETHQPCSPSLLLRSSLTLSQRRNPEPEGFELGDGSEEELEQELHHRMQQRMAAVEAMLESKHMSKLPLLRLVDSADDFPTGQSNGTVA